jgi:anionic cell wall polymer biosynthesis LytR-Cps2A-Psr (LCP) family protein
MRELLNKVSAYIKKNSPSTATEITSTFKEESSTKLLTAVSQLTASGVLRKERKKGIIYYYYDDTRRGN